MSESTTVVVERLVQRLQDGDEHAREELIQRTQKRVDRLTRSMLKDYKRVARWIDAEDIRQQASMRLWRALQDVVPTSSQHFFRLAATQIRRQLIDLSRHYFGPEGLGQKHHSWDNNSNDSAPQFDPPADDSSILPHSKWTEFHEHVEQLPEDERAAFDLLWYQELTQDEAAAVLNTSKWTVRRNFLGAKSRLAALLSNDESVSQGPNSGQ